MKQQNFITTNARWRVFGNVVSSPSHVPPPNTFELATRRLNSLPGVFRRPQKKNPMGTPIHAIAPSHEPRPSPPFSNTSIRSFGVTGSLRFGAPRILFKPLRNIDRRGGIKRTFIYLEAAAFLCVMRPIAGPPNGRCLAGCCHSAVRSRNQKRTAPSQSGQYTRNAR